MNKLLFTTVILVAYASPNGAQTASLSVAGNYEGMLGRLHLRLHIQQAPTGKLTGTIDSIDQGAVGVSPAQFVSRGTQFSFAVPAIHGIYKGEVSADGNTTSGTWNQGAPMPLVFTRRVQATAASLRLGLPKSIR